MLSDGRFWAGVAVGIAAVYGWNYWQQRRKNGQ